VFHKTNDLSSAQTPTVIPGLYVAGWAKRGSVGVVAATMYDAIETAESIVEDIEAGILHPRNQNVMTLLEQRGVRAIGYSEWMRLDEYERMRGAAAGRPSRVKVPSVAAALQVFGQ
jgi:hypothetical protein